MKIEEIKELVQIVIDSGVAELEVTQGDNKVCIKKNCPVTTQEIVVPAQAAMAPVPAPVAPQAAQHVAVPAAAVAAEPAPAEEEGLDYVKSPIVGTFYEAPAPDADTFVKVGDHISPGQVLCIVESMKLMNEIESEISGTIVAKLVENAKPVEYGEALFSVKPD